MWSRAAATLFVAVAAVAAAGGSEVRGRVDRLTREEADQILGILRERYVRKAELTDQELGRSTVEGLMLRHRRGMELLGGDDAPARPREALHAEVIGVDVAYLRLGTLDAAKLEEIDRALRGFAWPDLAGCILDLRASGGSGDAGLVAELLSRFVPADRSLFRLVQVGTGADRPFLSTRAPIARGTLLVLIDAEVSGPIEIVAEVSRRVAGAIVIGDATAGRAAEFVDVPLAGGMTLRIAVAEMVLPDGATPFGVGVRPDVPVKMDPAEKWRAIAASREGGIAPLVEERERPRMNEAALIAGINPEWAESSKRDGAEGTSPTVTPPSPPRDATIRRALDIAAAIGLYGEGTATQGSAAPPAPPDGAPGGSGEQGKPAAPGIAPSP